MPPVVATKTYVFAQGTFEGFHRWPDAPDEVAFLRTLHRHRFHWTLWWTVSHANRQKEFILLQREVTRAIATQQGTELWSCEHWASFLLNTFGASRAEVSEDGENGALVEWEDR